MENVRSMGEVNLGDSCESETTLTVHSYLVASMQNRRDSGAGLQFEGRGVLPLRRA